MTTTTNHAWREQAACRDLPTDVFFPEADDCSSNNYVLARRVCELCPVREDCLHYALANSIIHGMFGGLSPLQRRKAAKELGYTITTHEGDNR